MCLILFANEHHPAYRLILAANRDEFFERPTAPAAFWKDDSGLLAGRDLKSGGTWLGVTRTGRFAAVTNYREPRKQNPEAPSRGVLVTQFLRGRDDPEGYLHRLSRTADRYNGFNLLVGDAKCVFYFSNREGRVRRVEPGVHGLSNHLLDTPWPKVVQGKAALSAAVEEETVDPEGLLHLLQDRTSAEEADLPDTGVGADWERVLSPIFISTPAYGTRSSTALTIDCEGRVAFVEQTVPVPGEAPVKQTYRFPTHPDPP